MEENKVTFEKKWLDRAIPPRFDINYWLLKKVGLEGFRVLILICSPIQNYLFRLNL